MIKWEKLAAGAYETTHAGHTYQVLVITSVHYSRPAWVVTKDNGRADDTYRTMREAKAAAEELIEPTQPAFSPAPRPAGKNEWNDAPVSTVRRVLRDRGFATEDVKQAIAQTEAGPVGHQFIDSTDGRLIACLVCLGCGEWDLRLYLNAGQDPERAEDPAPASPFVADPANPTDEELAAAIERGLATGHVIDARDWLAAQRAKDAAEDEQGTGLDVELVRPSYDFPVSPTMICADCREDTPREAMVEVPGDVPGMPLFVCPACALGFTTACRWCGFRGHDTTKCPHRTPRMVEATTTLTTAQVRGGWPGDAIYGLPVHAGPVHMGALAVLVTADGGRFTGEVVDLPPDDAVGIEVTAQVAVPA